MQQAQTFAGGLRLITNNAPRPEANKPGPFVIMDGVVTAAFPSLQLYEIATQSGRVMASSSGTGAGMAAGTPTAYAVGDDVTISVDLRQPSAHMNRVIGGAARGVGLDYQYQNRTLSYPQVVGYGQNLYSSLVDLYLQAEEAQKRTPSHGYHATKDLLSTDWTVLTQLMAGGLGVEMFRTWLAAGPMNGIYFFHPHQLTRLCAMNYQFMTAGQEDLDRVVGDYVEQVSRRVYTTDEAIREKGPRELGVSGIVHGGRQRFLAAYDDSTPEFTQEPVVAVDEDGNEVDTGQTQVVENSGEETARTALFHEYVGLDGSWTLSSVASITLQKYVGINIPIEKLHERPDVPETDAEQDAEQDADAASRPLDLGPARYNPMRGDDGGHDDIGQVPIRNPRPPADQPVDGIVQALHAVEARVNYMARVGFERMTKEWYNGLNNEAIYGESLQHGWQVGQWKCLPRVVPLKLSKQTERKFYVGHAVITITDDGGILLQDAYNSSISMSGGDITLQAPGNITAIAGGNAYMLAGNDAGLQGRNAVEVVSAEGRLTLSSRGGPIRVDSGGFDLDTSASVPRTLLSPAGGGAPPFVVSATGVVALQGSGVYVNAAAGDIMLEAQGVLAWRAGGGEGALGATISMRSPTGDDLVLGTEFSYIPRLLSNRLSYQVLQHQSSGASVPVGERFSTPILDGFHEHLERVLGQSKDDLFSEAAAVDTFLDEDDTELQLAATDYEVIIPEPSYLTYQRFNGMLDGDDEFPIGQPTGWTVRRVEQDTGFVDYSYGGIRPALEITGFAALETANIIGNYFRPPGWARSSEDKSKQDCQ